MKRRGMSLLETLMAVSLSGLVLTLVATLLATLWKTDRQWRGDLHERQSLSRLEVALRSDAHQANSGACPDPGRLTLDLGEGRAVTYSVDEHRVLRLTTTGDTVQHRELYDLAAGAQIAVAIGGAEESAARSVRMTIAPAPTAQPGGRILGRAAVLEAALGYGRAAASRSGVTP